MASNPPAILTALHTGINYDMQRLSPISQNNARAGLRNDRTSMVRCFERNNNYHFELQERVGVTVRPSGRPICSTCPANGERACKHIWWLDNQILGARFQRGDHLEIFRDGSAVRVMNAQEGKTFHDLIEDYEFEKLAENRKWWIQDPESQTDAESIQNAVQDILSTFEPAGFLLKHHGDDNLLRLQDLSQSLFIRYRAAMINRLQSQPSLLFALQAAIPDEQRKLLDLSRLSSRLDRVFINFKSWVDTGAPSDGSIEDTVRAICGEIDFLQSFVRQHQRGMSPDLQFRLADILICILEALIAHAGDFLRRTPVSMPAYVSYDEQNRDLLLHMVNSIDLQQGFFVLDILRQLDYRVREHPNISERAEEIAERLRESQCPELYVEELEKITGLSELEE